MADIKYLELLAKDYPNIEAASAEIINLNAILALPKGTEYFLSDLHGEHEAFIHMLKSASGTIRGKIDEHYGGVLGEQDRSELAALIYNAEAEIKRRKKSEKNFNQWCTTVIYRLITICKSVSTKYTRSRVRRRLPKYLDYAMDELLHADDEENKNHYYESIINSVIECGIGEEFIKAMADVISVLAVDQLHIIGDIFDRGAHPDEILDFLMGYHDVDPIDEHLAAKMHKAIAIMQFKVEGQRIKAHPEYKMEKRLLLDKIDFEKGTIKIEGKEWTLCDTDFPTIDPNNPYKLSKDEEKVLKSLEASILNSEKLQSHIRFLFTHGALYKKVNGNLLYHGCIPMTETGEFAEVTINGRDYKGRALMDYLDEQVRAAYYSPCESEEIGRSGDLMWYLWEGSDSPLFGKEKMTTFERLFIADKAAHKEPTRPYYKLIKYREPCEKILKEFGLSDRHSKILNGHVPVKIKDGESPIKGGGLLYVIDGGISKAYQKQTGIAGYTFIFNSRFMALAEHTPYEPLKEDGTQKFVSPVVKIVETLPERMMVLDSDQGVVMVDQIEDMKQLVEAYRKGIIKEVY